MPDPWPILDRIDPESLVDARLELHHAVQLVAIGIARSLIPERDDDSHTALGWRDGAWWSEPIPGSDGLRAGLRPASLELVLGNAELSLFGKTREQGLEWLRQQLDALGLDGSKARLDIHYDLPDHPSADGAPFRRQLQRGFAQLADWYAIAEGLLAEMAEKYDSSPVVTWPHHFDSATLLLLGSDETDDEERPQIGIGLSPGDGSFEQPYFYVTPWPVPDEDPAELPHGAWRREPFFGAILTGEDLVAVPREEQEAAARDYLVTAIEGGLASLGETA